MRNNATYDYQFVKSLEQVQQHGIDSEDRTGIGTRKIFGKLFELNCAYDMLHILRVRRVAPRIAFEELMWMLNGHTDVSLLQDKNIPIWDGNSTREYLDRIGKSHIRENTIGKGYGYQFRNFNGVDQLKTVYDGLKNNPNGRRHVINLWNPSDFKDMALEPCHLMYNFVVTGNKLNLIQYIRSNDAILGNPTNIMFANFFLAIMAKSLGFDLGWMQTYAADYHVYKNHEFVIEPMKESLVGALGKPIVRYNFKRDFQTFDDMLSLTWEDVQLSDYDYVLNYSRKDLPMAV